MPLLVPFSASVSSDRLHAGGRRQRRLPHASDESGQILVITGVALVLMLVSVGLVIDVGHAMLVQRQLQAGVDAAALAGVQELPDAPAAEATAQQYSATPGNKNAVNTVDNAVTVAQASCLAGVPGCSRRDGGVNGITVSSTSTVPTWFGRIIGIDQMKVSAKATACSPCQVKPLDIMIVLDRTGSMCQFAPGQPDPNCTDLRNARQGVETFASMLDPSLDKLGLVLTPPTLMNSMVANCGNPVGAGYLPWNGTPNPNVPTGNPQRNFNGRYYGYEAFFPYLNGVFTPDPLGSTPSQYIVAGLNGADGFPADDYLVYNTVSGSWDLNYAQSAFLQRLNCTRGAGSTSYALAVEAAQYELSRNGRGSVQDVIIFLSDGAANTWPKNVPNGHWLSGWSPWGQRPCGAGIQAAANAKGGGTVIYTIGYDLDAGAATPEQCRRPNQSNGYQNGGNPVEPGMNAELALQAMATSPQYFYKKPNPGQLNDIFRAIAIDLSGSRGRLIDNTSPNLIG